MQGLLFSRPLNAEDATDVLAKQHERSYGKDAWFSTPGSQRDFFCADPACAAVYFADDGSILLTSPLRTQIGVKQVSDDSPWCYCVGVTRADFPDQPATKDFVITQTMAGLCSCDTRNPSGRCCLKDFPLPAIYNIRNGPAAG